MSDINLTFPVWATPVFFAILYWPMLLAASVVLGGLGLVVRGWFRAALLGLAALALAPCLMLAVGLAADAIRSASAQREWAQTHETLSAPLEAEGLSLPAGSAVEWADPRRTDVVAVDLPGPTQLLGVTLTGRLEKLSGRWWAGTLATDGNIDGWPCGPGEVWITLEKRLMKCTLAADHEDQGFVIPAGGEVTFAATGAFSDLRLPDNRTMALPSVATTLPGGASLFLRPDGAIERAYVPEPGTLRIGDVALRFEIRWVYAEAAQFRPPAVGLCGELAADTMIDGALAQAGRLVSVDLRGFAVRFVPNK